MLRPDSKAQAISHLGLGLVLAEGVKASAGGRGRQPKKAGTTAQMTELPLQPAASTSKRRTTRHSSAAPPAEPDEPAAAIEEPPVAAPGARAARSSATAGTNLAVSAHILRACGAKLFLSQATPHLQCPPPAVSACCLVL